MIGPLFIPLCKPFHKTARDKDLRRPDRRLALTEPKADACPNCGSTFEFEDGDCCEGCGEERVDGDE